MIRLKQTPSRYAIRSGYAHRADKLVVFHDDRSFRDEWQREVYETAAAIATLQGASTVYDVGCGSAFKLLKHFSNLNTVGFELEPTLSWLRDTYPDRDWRSPYLAGTNLKADVVICADVVEHMGDPDVLMKFLAGIDFDTLVLSTPERLIKYGHNHSGPPENPSHAREWTFDEMEKYASRWFRVVDHVVVNREQATQMFVLGRK